MPDGRDILREWQDAMQSIASTARGAAGRTELPKALTGPMQRQLELLQEVVERERRLQADVLGRLLGPVDAVFDLLEESGRTFRAQAEALEEASRALEQTAALMQVQAEVFERAIKALREPAEVMKSVAGVERAKRTAKPRKR
jgi:hypothetical protein